MTAALILFCCLLACIFWGFVRKLERNTRFKLGFVVIINQLAGPFVAIVVAYAGQILLAYLPMTSFIAVVLLAGAIGASVITLALGKFRCQAWRRILMGNLLQAAILFPMLDKLMKLANN
jgi:hypothetical protein